MTNNPCGSFPNLQILTTQSLLLRERPDAGRIDPIIACMTREGVLRDPPILTTTDRGDQPFVVLEGTDYVLALMNLRIPYVLGQIVEPGHGIITRALRVNYPLTELMEGTSLVEKNNILRRWLRGKIMERSIRCYEEATILFDD